MKHYSQIKMIAWGYNRLQVNIHLRIADVTDLYVTLCAWTNPRTFIRPLGSFF